MICGPHGVGGCDEVFWCVGWAGVMAVFWCVGWAGGGVLVCGVGGCDGGAAAAYRGESETPADARDQSCRGQRGWDAPSPAQHTHTTLSHIISHFHSRNSGGG